MSKRIVQTLEPEAQLWRRSRLYCYIFTPDRVLGNAATTAQAAWHEASVFLRAENYDKWFEAARDPKKRIKEATQ